MLRRLLEGWRPLLPRRRLIGQAIGVYGVDMEVQRMKDEKAREWREAGYSEHLISMALSLADEWAVSMASAFAPPELKDAVIRHSYPKALEVADRWIRAMGV
jgi:hypothetical protein